MRPSKLEAFRLTSSSKTLIEQVADIYGGTPAEWYPQGGGAGQWEVYTTAKSLPVVVPPTAVSQWYESWSGGACVRRCDGERMVLGDDPVPCLCSPDPAERACKPTTRVALMLADMPGIGVWRLESHGYYAATELPAVAELLAAAGGYVPARLELEERSARRPKADGNGMETRRWMVPVLHVDARPADLLALTNGSPPAIEATGQAPAIAAAPSDLDAAVNEVLRLIGVATTVDALRDVWKGLADSGITVGADAKAKVTEAFWAKQKQITGRDQTESPPEVEPDKEATWASVLSQAGHRGWNTADTSKWFREQVGKDVTEATGWDMQLALEGLTAGEVS
jgi:hypothetical protein